jgi:hypothetical protein
LGLALLGIGNSAGATVSGAPQVIVQPQSVVVTNVPVGFFAKATGQPTTHVQWYKSTMGTAWHAVLGATSDSYTTMVSLGSQYRAVFSNKDGKVATRVAQVMAPSSGTGTPTQDTSGSWSGYVSRSGPYSAVSGSWVVPTVTCATAAPSYTLEWVGIDGWGNNTVEQDGTETDCINGVQVTRVWYEMWGDSALNGGLQLYAPKSDIVAPGDEVTAGVALVSGTWEFLVTDSTAGWSFSASAPSPTPAPALSSVEAIVEAPREGCPATCTTAALAKFSPVTFSNLSATSATGAGAFVGAFAVSMINIDGSGATPGALANGSYTDTWT